MRYSAHSIATVRTSYQTVLVAFHAPPHPSLLLNIDLPAAATSRAGYKPHPAASVTDKGGVLARNLPKQPYELPGLMHLPNLLSVSDPSIADEHLRKREGPTIERGLKLAAEGGVQGDVALVDGEAEPEEDGADGAAVLEGLANPSERGAVEDDLGALGRIVVGEQSGRGEPRPVVVGQGSGKRG